MRFLVTGATGFLGRYVVAAALRRGHAVTALSRSPDMPQLGWTAHPNLTIVHADLSIRGSLTEAVAGVDTVLHLAAAKGGNLPAQKSGTVTATENLLAAMSQSKVRRIVLISSFSVYDYLSLPSRAMLTEDSPLEKDALKRDAYAQTKLAQERLVRDYASTAGWDLTVLRPGVIYGKDNLFTPRIGIAVGRVWLRIGRSGQLPLTYVENCAQAIVLAAESAPARGEAQRESAFEQTLNVVDDDPPTQRQYASLLQERLSPRPMIVPIAWSVMRFLAGLASGTNNVLLGGRARIPGLFVPARLHARCKPLRYSNEKIKNVLKWTPRYSLIAAMDRCLGSSVVDLTKVELSPPKEPPPGAGPETGKAEVAA